MKHFILINMLVFTSAFALGADQYFIVNGKQTDDKVDVIKALIQDPKAQVFKCDAQELTKKATLRKK